MVTPYTHGEGERAAEVGPLRSPTDRRTFLRWSGTAAAAAMLAACDQASTDPTGLQATPDAALAAVQGQVTINLRNDIGILNFAYALEQLEAAFYIEAVNRMYGGATDEEQTILTQIKTHEVIHREFFKAALGSAAIPKLAVNFSSIDFNSRASVLGAAKVFEDTGVGAYNGAAQFLFNVDYLVVAGKIVSVEARHASAIRDVLGRTFAPSAFDAALTFEQVLRRAGPFIATPIALSNSPTARQTASRTASEQEMDS